MITPVAKPRTARTRIVQLLAGALSLWPSCPLGSEAAQGPTHGSEAKAAEHHTPPAAPGEQEGDHAAKGHREKAHGGKENDQKDVEAVPTEDSISEGVDPAFRGSAHLVASSNLVVSLHQKRPEPGDIEFQRKLEEARRQREAHDPKAAAKIFMELLESPAGDVIKRSAWLELAIVSQEVGNLPQAQRTFTEFLKRFPGDESIPEVLLRQGLIYRQMGLPQLALTKFYAVLSSALGLKSERLALYQKLVLQAQTEIADTYYLEGKYNEAADFYRRLMRLDSPQLNAVTIHYKLIQALDRGGKPLEVMALAGDFLRRRKETAEEPEVRYLLAGALQKLGRTDDAIREVAKLLQAQRSQAPTQPGNWSYWQQRTGMQVAKYLVEQGDDTRALQIYGALVSLSEEKDWRWPIHYQMGLAYERLGQGERALASYDAILATPETSAGATKPAGPESLSKGAENLREMARWRRNFVSWQLKTETTLQELGAHPVSAVP